MEFGRSGLDGRRERRCGDGRILKDMVLTITNAAFEKRVDYSKVWYWTVMNAAVEQKGSKKNGVLLTNNTIKA